MFSILHITDLHRAKTDPISNSELLSALVGDRESYVREDPQIRTPDAIVVSGDLIQGVVLAAPNFEATLAAQYEVALDFLISLTERFLNGDRSRVVIVPGNHDIDWNVAFGAMEVVPPDQIPLDLPGALYEPNSLYRWDWKSLQLYRIIDNQAYDRRLAAFWNCFERFYADTPGMMRVNAWADANLYRLDEGRIAVAAFNSCVGNDCFAFQGAISPDAIARSHLDLKDFGPWRLRIAVWHHDVEGPPHRGDYMDVELVRGMIGRGFRLGLYGHQHRPQITPQRARLLTDDTMVIASAGSLCAGRWELPTGARRGYSIIEINDEYSGARIHVREMRFANLFARATLSEFSGKSYVDLEWSTPLDAGGRPEDANAEIYASALMRAEDALRAEHDPTKTLAILAQINIKGDVFARRLLTEAVKAAGDPKILIEKLGIPQTIEELVLLVDAHLSIPQISSARNLLVLHAKRLQMTTAVQNDLDRRIGLASWSST